MTTNYPDTVPGQLIMDSAVDTAWRTYSWSNAMEVTSLHELTPARRRAPVYHRCP
jgi:hypothetical protein